MGHIVMPSSSSPKSSRPATDIAVRLLAVGCKPENKFCSECSTQKPTWACTVVVRTSPGGDESQKQMIGAFVCSPCSHAMGKLLKSSSCEDIVDVRSLVGVDKNKCKCEMWAPKMKTTGRDPCFLQPVVGSLLAPRSTPFPVVCTKIQNMN